MGRSYAMAQQAMLQGYTSTGVTMDEAGELTQLAVQQTMDAQMMRRFNQPPHLGPEIDRLIREQTRTAKEEKLKQEIAEPFWAWHERKENETKRMGSNDRTSSGTSVRLRSGPDRARDISDHLVDSIRYSGMGRQGQDWANLIAARLGETAVDPRSA